MSVFSPADPRSLFWCQPWIRVRTSFGQGPIIPHGVVGASGGGVDANGPYVRVFPFGASGSNLDRYFLVNGPTPIGVTSGSLIGEGLATTGMQGAWFAYDNSDTPGVGQVWGPKQGTQLITKNTRGGGGVWVVGANSTTADGQAITWGIVPGFPCGTRINFSNFTASSSLSTTPAQLDFTTGSKYGSVGGFITNGGGYKNDLAGTVEVVVTATGDLSSLPGGNSATLSITSSGGGLVGGTAAFFNGTTAPTAVTFGSPMTAMASGGIANGDTITISVSASGSGGSFTLRCVDIALLAV